jgi:hypothetical protein
VWLEGGSLMSNAEEIFVPYPQVNEKKNPPQINDGQKSSLAYFKRIHFLNEPA